MDTKIARDIAQIIKREPLSVLIILSLFFLPFVFTKWIGFFPRSWEIFIVLLILGVWIYALCQLRKETIKWRRKTILYNYLKKEKRHTIKHLTKEWYAKRDFTEEIINELLKEYPEVFKMIEVKRKGEYFQGVGLVVDTRNSRLDKN